MRKILLTLLTTLLCSVTVWSTTLDNAPLTFGSTSGRINTVPSSSGTTNLGIRHEGLSNNVGLKGKMTFSCTSDDYYISAITVYYLRNSTSAATGKYIQTYTGSDYETGYGSTKLPSLTNSVYTVTFPGYNTTPNSSTFSFPSSTLNVTIYVGGTTEGAGDNGFCITYYSVTLTASGGGCAATIPGNISKGSACAGNDLTLTSAGSPASGDTWYWQASSTGTSTTNSGTTYEVSSAGTYYVRSYNTSGDCWSDAKSVTVAAGDWTSPTISGASSVTVGNTITLTGSPSGGTWESSDETKAEVNSSGVVSGVAAGNVNITYSKDECTSDNHAVTVSAVVCSPSISASPSSASYCKDDVATALYFTGTGHNAQKWQKSTDSGSSWSDIDGATNATYTPSTSATGSTQYRVVTTCDSYTTTATSSAATVTVKTSPNLTISLDE